MPELGSLSGTRQELPCLSNQSYFYRSLRLNRLQISIKALSDFNLPGTGDTHDIVPGCLQYPGGGGFGSCQLQSLQLGSQRDVGLALVAANGSGNFYQGFASGIGCIAEQGFTGNLPAAIVKRILSLTGREER